MNEENTEVVAPETTTETTVEPVAEKPEEKSSELKSALAQKEHFRQKFEKTEAERIALQNQLNKAPKGNLDVSDYIDISASLEGLDQREKSYLAEQHKLTGKPLTDIRKSEDFQFWDSSYKAKVEKERSLMPSTKQSESAKEMSLTERLRGSSLEEKEKVLTEMGLYKQVRPRADRREIGGAR